MIAGLFVISLGNFVVGILNIRKPGFLGLFAIINFMLFLLCGATAVWRIVNP